jgi:hypothetical protein
MNNARLLIVKCSPRKIKFPGMVSHYGSRWAVSALSCQGITRRLRTQIKETIVVTLKKVSTLLYYSPVDGIPCQRPVIECI